MPAAFICLIKGTSAARDNWLLFFSSGSVEVANHGRDPGASLAYFSHLIVEAITASQDPISQGWTLSYEEGRSPDRVGTQLIADVISKHLGNLLLTRK